MIHFCDYLYYQVLNPERTCNFHVCMPDTRGGNSKIDINIFEAIHSRLGGTCLSLYPLFFNGVIGMMHDIVDLNSPSVEAWFCILFISKV